MDKNNNIAIPEWHIWDLKTAIAEFIVPRLDSFIQIVKKGKSNSIPQKIFEEEGINSEEQATERWINYLEAIFFSFNYHVNPENYSHIPIEVKQQKQQKGLVLFAEYYLNLWD